MNPIVNIILLAVWFVLTTLFLREIVNPKTWTENNGILSNTYSLKRSYIVQKYIPLFMLLLFWTIIIIYYF